MGYEETFDKSYERVKGCEIDGKGFFHSFYETFLTASPEIAEHFASTDMQNQIRMMEKSFYSLFIFYATQNANDYLKSIAQQHDRHHANIAPQLYDLWLESLISTVNKYDPNFDANIELAWRIVMAAGIAYMKFKHHNPTAVDTPEREVKELRS